MKGKTDREARAYAWATLRQMREDEAALDKARLEGRRWYMEQPSEVKRECRAVAKEFNEELSLAALMVKRNAVEFQRRIRSEAMVLPTVLA